MTASKAPLWIRTRAKSSTLTDGSRARRECAPRCTLFYYLNSESIKIFSIFIYRMHMYPIHLSFPFYLPFPRLPYIL